MAHVYVANSHHQVAHVSISERLGFELLDLGFDVLALATGLEELEATAEAFELPKEMKTFEDVYKTLKSTAKLLSDAKKVGSKGFDAAKKFVELFKLHSFEIFFKSYKDIKAVTGAAWLKPASIAGMFGAKTFNMTVLTDDGKKVINFDTNHDDSWIVTDPAVVRSKYGTIWVPDPDRGKHNWEGSGTSERPIEKHGGFHWRVMNETGFQLVFQYAGGRSCFFHITMRELSATAQHMRNWKSARRTAGESLGEIFNTTMILA